jgi:hypothetical protein
MWKNIRGYLLYFLKNFTLFFKDLNFLKTNLLKLHHLVLKIVKNILIKILDIIFINLLFIFFYPLKKRKGNGKIILLGSYYANNNYTISDDYKGIFQSLKDIEVNFENYFFDKKNYFYSKLFLIIKILSNIDIIILSSNDTEKTECLSYFQIYILRKIFKKKLINILWDTTEKTLIEKKEHVLKLFNSNIIIDNPDFKNFHKYYEKNILIKWPMMSYSFLEKNFTSILKKENDVCFMGQVSSHRNVRMDAINYLKDKTKIILSTKDRKNFISDKEYYRILSESKISINFSYGIDCHQIKGRVFDSIFYECLVLEEKNSQITNLFEPNKEIILFENKEDLLDKISYYLKNDLERQNICKNAKKRLLENYNPKKFWDNLLID